MPSEIPSELGIHILDNYDMILCKVKQQFNYQQLDGQQDSEIDVLELENELVKSGSMSPILRKGIVMI